MQPSMRLAPDIMRFSHYAKCFSAATASLTKKTVSRIIVVTTPLPQRSFIFDPG
ncbi:hypothetical protein A2U01_0087715, partial [Trifolium medium]|nr:hypothetical protein [Trifolium medium]